MACQKKNETAWTKTNALKTEPNGTVCLEVNGAIGQGVQVAVGVEDLRAGFERVQKNTTIFLARPEKVR